MQETSKELTDCIRHPGYIRPNGRAGYRDRNGVRKPAYVWAWEDANGRERAPGMVIRHLCNNPACINPDHLAEGTQGENMIDCSKAGNNPKRKLTEAQVRAIRADTTKTHAQWGRELGVGQTSIRYIRHRINYAWVTP